MVLELLLGTGTGAGANNPSNTPSSTALPGLQRGWHAHSVVTIESEDSDGGIGHIIRNRLTASKQMVK